MSEISELRSLIDDHEGIRETDTVLRVIQPAFRDGRVVQSRGYQDQAVEEANRWGLADACASVNVRRIWEGESGARELLLRDFPAGSGLLEVSVLALRGLVTLGPSGVPVPQGVMLDPRPNRPWHAVLFSRAGGKRSKGAMRALVEASDWFWHPDDEVE